MMFKTRHCVWLLFASLPCRAADSDQNYLDLDIEQLLQVEVSGSTLRAESLQKVPASVTVFTREQLDALGLEYLHELINLVPGFQTVRPGDSSITYTYSLRGRRQGNRAREILLMVDGRVFEDPRSSGADSGVNLFPLANIERVEFIRGPGSAIYGSGAFTGVINIISRRQQHHLALAVGANNARSIDAQLSAGETLRSDLLVHLKADAGQAYNISGINTRDPRRETQLDYQLSINKTHLQAFYSNLDASDFYVLERLDNDFNHYRQEYRQLRLEQDLQPSDTWTTKVSAGYEATAQYLDGQLVAPGALLSLSQPASAEPMRARVRLAGEAYRVTLANDISLGMQRSVQWGGEWLKERETKAYAGSNYNLNQLSAQQYPIEYFGDYSRQFPVSLGGSRQVLGVYGQWLQDLSQNLRLVLGGRYDNYQDLGSHVSPRLDLVYQWNQVHSFKLLYGEAFRAPSFAETALINNPVQTGNPELDNETVRTLELVWLGSWKNLSAGAAVFHNAYQQPITAGVINGVRTYLNGEDQSSYGGGLRLDWQINSAWMLRLFHGNLIDLPDEAFREAKNLNTLIVNFHQNAWVWSLSGSYQGKRGYMVNTQERAQLEGYALFNSQLSYQFRNSTRLSLAIKNLFDKNYDSPEQGSNIAGGVPNRGREWRLGLDWSL